MLNKNELQDIFKLIVKITPFFKNATKGDFIKSKTNKKLEKGRTESLIWFKW